MYGNDISTEQAHEQPPLHIQGHPLSQWHRSEAVVGSAPIPAAASGLLPNSSEVGMLRNSSLQYADNTSNAEESDWVQSNQTVMEFTENWADCYGTTEGRTDSRRFYDFNVLAQECANLINPGLVASENHIRTPMKIRFKDNVQPRARAETVGDPDPDLSVQLDKLKIFSTEFPQVNPHSQRDSAGEVSILKNSLLQSVENTSKAPGCGWVQASNQTAMRFPENWVKSDVMGNGKSVSSNPYNFNTLTQECENLNNGNRSSDNVNVNELSCYFDDILHIPKKITEWADRMYT
ncbi:uncharacterized protein LOC121404591 [Drosophila obscura]|uniref:uncharacterized protein LOC121404591 n=1 Tax=Drosophila obscura TaxID=7282 RepID=UPI001BB1EA24|nr:uncharacterized protein LOC121404591 [Drosophila obscura]